MSAAPLTTGEPKKPPPLLPHPLPSSRPARTRTPSLTSHASRAYFPTHRQLNDHIDLQHRICTEQVDVLNKARGVAEHCTPVTSKTGMEGPIEVWADRSLDKEKEKEKEEEEALALISAVMRCWTKESLGRDLPMALAVAGDEEEEEEEGTAGPSGSASSASSLSSPSRH